MKEKLVMDLMVPLDEYPLLPQDRTLLDAAIAIDQAQQRLPEGRQPYRAVLVADDRGKIIGKVGQLAFLKALEPQNAALGEMERLRVAGVTSDFISKVTEHFRFFQEDLRDLCRRARNIRLREAMKPVTDHIDATASLSEAICRMVTWQTLSILVTHDQEVVGLLRLSDLFEAASQKMRDVQT